MSPISTRSAMPRVVVVNKGTAGAWVVKYISTPPTRSASVQA